MTAESLVGLGEILAPVTAAGLAPDGLGGDERARDEVGVGGFPRLGAHGLARSPAQLAERLRGRFEARSAARHARAVGHRRRELAQGSRSQYPAWTLRLHGLASVGQGGRQGIADT